MAKDDLTPEEIEILANANRKIWDNILPRSIGNHNPNWVQAAKGTPLEKMSYPEIVDYTDRLKPIFLKSWKNFKDGWINAFGGRDKNPLKLDPKKYLDQYITHISKNPSEFKKGNMGAAEWLKNKFKEENFSG